MITFIVPYTANITKKETTKLKDHVFHGGIFMGVILIIIQFLKNKIEYQMIICRDDNEKTAISNFTYVIIACERVQQNCNFWRHIL